MKNIYYLQSKTGNFNLKTELDVIIFGNLNDVNQDFVIHADQFYVFYESLKSVLISIHNHSLKCSEIFENEEKGTVYYYEILKIFDEVTKTEQFVSKFFIKNNSNDIIYVLLLSEKQLFSFLKVFSYNMISCLGLNNLCKLWLKHCSTLNIDNYRNNSFKIYKEAETFLSHFMPEDDIFSLVELFEQFYYIILSYKNILLLVQ